MDTHDSLNGSDKPVPNAQFTWYFHDYTRNTPGGLPGPTKQDLRTAVNGLCKPLKKNKDYYEQNFYTSNSKKVFKECRDVANGTLGIDRAIDLRDTKSYLEDLIIPYAKQLDVEDMLESIPKPGT